MEVSLDYIQSGGKKFDVLKFVLCLTIVVLHSGLLPYNFLPLLRLAVPLFFIMTSYFFHLKLYHCNSQEEKRNRLIAFVRRNFQLYLFWSILLSPIVLVLRKSLFAHGIGYFVSKMLKYFFITGFFPASWFIIASVYSVCIIFFLSKYLNNLHLFILALLLYGVALLDSNYGGLLSPEATAIMDSVKIRHFNNVPAAMIWVVIGKWLAEKPVRFTFGETWIYLILFSILYVVEFCIIKQYGLSVKSDCFIMSLPLCTIIFIAIGQHQDVRFDDTLLLRKLSIIIYCVHASIIGVIEAISCHFFTIPKLLVFLIVIFLSLIIAFAVIFLYERKNISLLKYAY